MKQRVTGRVYAPCLFIHKAYIIARGWTENVLSTRRHKKCCIIRARAGHPRREFPAIIAIPRAHVTYRSQTLGVANAEIYFLWTKTFFPADHPKKYARGGEFKCLEGNKWQYDSPEHINIYRLKENATSNNVVYHKYLHKILSPYH